MGSAYILTTALPFAVLDSDQQEEPEQPIIENHVHSDDHTHSTSHGPTPDTHPFEEAEVHPG